MNDILCANEWKYQGLQAWFSAESAKSHYVPFVTFRKQKNINHDKKNFPETGVLICREIKRDTKVFNDKLEQSSRIEGWTNMRQGHAIETHAIASFSKKHIQMWQSMLALRCFVYLSRTVFIFVYLLT